MKSTLKVQDCASYEDVTIEEIIFYPNPFREVIYSNVNLEDYEIEVFDAKGRNIDKYRIDKNQLILTGIKGIITIIITCNGETGKINLISIE